jgi:hypothetical protein
VNLKTLGGGMMMYKRRSVRRKNVTKVYITTRVMKTYRNTKKLEKTQRKLWAKQGVRHTQNCIDEDVSYRIRAGWVKWKSTFGILCDKVPNKLKGKFYITTIRPAMMYGVECWATKGQHIQKMSVAEMRMLRWICGHTRKDQIRNDDIQDKLGVAPIQEKLIQHRLRWFGHIQRRPSEALVRSGILSRPENTRRGRGRPRLTWEEAIKRDLNEWNISKELALDRSAWEMAIHVLEPWFRS